MCYTYMSFIEIQNALKHCTNTDGNYTQRKKYSTERRILSFFSLLFVQSFPEILNQKKDNYCCHYEKCFK